MSLELSESTLYVAVSNPGAAFDPPDVPPGGDCEGGRALLLVDGVADR